MKLDNLVTVIAKYGWPTVLFSPHESAKLTKVFYFQLPPYGYGLQPLTYGLMAGNSTAAHEP